MLDLFLAVFIEDIVIDKSSLLSVIKSLRSRSANSFASISISIQYKDSSNSSSTI